MIQKTRYGWWVIVLLLLFATSLSFLDRQVLSVVIIEIKNELNINSINYGFITSSFLISYAIMFTLGGVLIDRFGSRLGLAFSLGLWSFVTLFQSIATSAFHFGIIRFFMGGAEGSIFPGAIKAVMEWVPKNKHALANGIAIGGSAIGAVVAPPLSVYLLGIVGWRGVFVVTGGFGLLWLLFWLFFTRKKRQSIMQSPEVNHRQPVAPKERIRLTTLLKKKEVKVFVAIRFILDPIFYFYMFWIPKYLNEVHALSLDSIGRILWIPFLALGLANVLGGWVSDRIFRKTANLNLSRKLVMGIAAALTIPIAFVGFLHSYVLVLVLMSLAFFAHGLWITNYITSISDMFGRQVTSTVVGLSGSGGAISSLVLNPVIGLVITKFSYSPLWWYAGLMYPMAFLLLLKFIPRIQLLKAEVA